MSPCGTRQLLAALTLAVACITLFSACKGDSAPVAKAVPIPASPELRVLPAAADPLTVNPFTGDTWKNAAWLTLGPPLRDARTPPLTRVAAVYGATHLYVAFLCQSPDMPPIANNLAGTPIPLNALDQDRAEVWLDTSSAQNGTEVFAIVVTSAGQVQRTWYRSTMPPEPMEDGSPNFQHPMMQIPDYPLPGLDIRNTRGTLQGHPAWATVVAIPFHSLPLPLRVDPAQVKPGSHWKVNLIRADFIKKEGQSREVLQANLAPVYPSCQQVSPYRMTKLLLDSSNSAVALSPGN
ncbi:MAG: hypothetical protein WCI73_02470 [Phycisphaerae bacterium]